LGLVYFLVSQGINAVFLPAIPLFQPPLGFWGNVALGALWGGILGLICAWPYSTAIGVVLASVASISVSVVRGLAGIDEPLGRLVIIAGPDAVYYQGRSTALVPSPGQAFDDVFQRYAALHGPFVLDGELVFLDACGGEHRTGAQAAQTNANNDRPQHEVKSCISVFKALF
jgi:hypothetical protein